MLLSAAYTLGNSMQESLEILKVCVRVLSAVNTKAVPDARDIEALRHCLGGVPPADLDELACTVIAKAVRRRAQARAAMKEC